MTDREDFSLLDGTIEVFRLIFSHLGLFLGISAVTALPYAAIMFSKEGLNMASLFELLILITFPAGIGAASKAVDGIRSNGQAKFLDCLKAGFSKSGSYLILVPIFFFGMVVIALPMGLAIQLIVLIQESFLVVFLVSLALLSLVLAPLFVAIPAIVLEQQTTFASLKRSAELTSGKILKISLFIFLWFCVLLLAIAIIFNDMNLGKALEEFWHAIVDFMDYRLILLYIFFSTILFVSCGVFYKDCYKLTESKKVEDLANVF